jgi:hypothetical protein
MTPGRRRPQRRVNCSYRRTSVVDTVLARDASNTGNTRREQTKKQYLMVVQQRGDQLAPASANLSTSLTNLSQLVSVSLQRSALTKPWQI